MYTIGNTYNNGGNSFSIAEISGRDITLVFLAGARYVINRFKLAAFISNYGYNLA